MSFMARVTCPSVQGSRDLICHGALASSSSRAHVRVRGTDIGFSNKPRYCFLFIFLSFFCFFSFFPSFSLLAMSGSFLLPVHNSPAAPAADEIWVQKKSASFPTRLRLGFVVVLSWISPCFVYLKSLSNVRWRGIRELYKTQNTAIEFLDFWYNCQR